MKQEMTATGFDLQPLPGGEVLIEFFGDDGVPFNSQTMTKDCLMRLPVVATMLLLLVDEGVEATLAYLNRHKSNSQITEPDSVP